MESIDEYRWMFAAEYPAVVRTVYLVLYDYARSQKIAQDAFVSCGTGRRCGATRPQRRGCGGWLARSGLMPHTGAAPI